MILMTQQEVIKAFMKSLDETNLAGEAALNEAIRACSPFKSFEELKAAMIKDCKNARSGNDFLKNYCGIDYSTKDVGAITGSDAGGSTSKNDADTIPESGSLKYFTGSSFKVNDLTVKLAGGKTYSQLSASEKFIWRGLYTWWVKGALDLIAESYGDNFSYGINSSAMVNELYVNFYNEATRNYAKTSSDFDAYGNTSKTTLNINMYYWDSLKNNLTKANSLFDRDIAHELTHAVMHANINYYAIGLLPAFVREGSAELTIGIEDYRKVDIKKLANNPNLLSQALSTDISKGTVPGIENPSYAGGFIFFRYLARQASDFNIENKIANKKIQTFYGYDQIKNSAANVSVTSGAGNDYISNDGSNSTIKGGNGNDSIHNWKDHVKLYGGAGNDTVHNDNYYDSANYVTISGGSGNDDITNHGDKVIIVGGAGTDSIYNYGAKTTVSGGYGNDYILNYGKRSSVVGSKDDDIIYNDSISSNSTLSGGAGNDSIWNYGSKVTISGGSGDDYIANWGKNVSIKGGSGNDSIWGDSGNDSLQGDAGNDIIFGGKGNDTLWGGKGNDSLWGGDGKDTFVYKTGEGSDTIFDYSSGDMLKILKSNGAAGGKYKKSKFSNGTLALTIGTGSVIFEDVTTATTFNINGNSYKISGSKLVRK